MDAHLALVDDLRFNVKTARVIGARFGALLAADARFLVHHDNAVLAFRRGARRTCFNAGRVVAVLAWGGAPKERDVGIGSRRGVERGVGFARVVVHGNAANAIGDVVFHFAAHGAGTASNAAMQVNGECIFGHRRPP